MTVDPKKIRDALYRHSFEAFLERAYREITGKDDLQLNWHHRLICQALEDCYYGREKRLIITLPPRSLKSVIASVAFPAWVLGKNPAKRLVCASYSGELSASLSNDCRRLMASAFYRSLFPASVISPSKNTQTEFHTNHGGLRLATSPEGTLTGRGGDMIVIDDPIKPADGLSETKRKSVNNWYSNTAYTRLDNKKEGCIIIVMQRIHVEDLVGHVLDKEEWRHINLPATAVKNERHILRRPNRKLYILKRKVGDLLHPEREPKHILENLRKTLGEYEYSSQYQQMPAPPGGGIIKFEWFKQYKELPVEKPMRILQSWDTASKVDDHNDFSVCTTWYQYENAYYLVDMYREKLEFPQLYGAVRQQYERHKPSIVVIEDKNSGVHLIQQLRQDTCIPVKPNIPKTDKATRAMAMTPQIEAGNVFIPSGARWLPDFKLEVIHFPKGKHDDQIDSVTQALEYFADHKPSAFHIG